MINSILAICNNSKLFTGLVMLVMNISGKYIAKDIPIHVDNFMAAKIFRPLAVFCVGNYNPLHNTTIAQ